MYLLPFYAVSFLVANFLFVYGLILKNNVLYFTGFAIFNVVILLSIYLIQRLNKKNKSVQDELKNVREELTAAFSELSDYTKSLEESNKKIKSLEEENLNDQEQINEILSELSMYTNQLESIVNTIDSGICTIDRNYIIQSDFNKGFKDLFGEREYWESSIFDTVFYNLTSDEKKEIKEFIDVAFSNASTSDDMINAANPVPEFIYIYNNNGNIQEKYIGVKVSRIVNEAKEVVKLMFIFNDVTLQKELEEDLKQKEKKYLSDLHILTNIFQHDRDIITTFLNDLNERIKILNDLIDEIEINSENSGLLKEIQRVLHSIKGEAFSLGFEDIARACADMESFVKEHYESTIGTEENLALLELFSAIKEWGSRLEEIGKKIFSFTQGDSNKLESNFLNIDRELFNRFKDDFKSLIDRYKKGSLDIDDLEDYYNRIVKLDWVDLKTLEKEIKLVVEKTSLHYGKKVKLNFIYDIDSIPVTKYKLLKEVFLHLVRNSISHGIEKEEDRLRLKKNPEGRINIHVFDEEDRYIIRYSDDGKGFDLDAIKRKAIEKGLIKEDEEVEEKELLNLTFMDGFSMNDEPDMVSGTGVGMSIIKKNIVYLLYGKIVLRSNPGKGISMTMSFPK